MRAIVFGNGTYEDDDFYLKYIEMYCPDMLICADGGANAVRRLGLKPDVLLGDFDSVKAEVYDEYKNIRILTFEKRKDYTDSYLAIQYAFENGCDEIVLFGMTGTRLDHSLANIYLLKFALDNGAMAKIVNEYNEVFLLDNAVTLTGVKGRTISLLPYTDKVSGIFISGVDYPLDDAVMVKENPYGVSNYATEDIVQIRVDAGMMIVVLTRDEY